jgi:hypothetical protein
MTTLPKPDTTLRWRQARDRARAEGIVVSQVAGSGQWVATSGTRRGVAYALAVTGNLAHGCECPAGQHEQDVCKHRAAFYDLIGAFPALTDVLEAEDLARDAAAIAAPRPCSWCAGRGKSFSEHYLEIRPCGWCDGTGERLAA